MKKILLTLVMALATVVTTTATDVRSVGGTIYVYICTGSSSQRYHLKETCAGGSCKGDVIRVTLEEATSDRWGHRTPCGTCCKNFHPNN